MVDVIEGRSFPRESPIDCPLCGAHNAARVIDARYGMKASVAECKPCRLAYQTPRPTDEASQAYMNMRWSSADRYVADAERKLGGARKKAVIARKAAPNARTLLDFGAGSGAFVAAARAQGFEAVGVERSEAARARAMDFYGVELLGAVPDGSTFDVITLWDVVEHLRDPVGLLAWLRDHIIPGGVMILETGNYENWLRLLKGDRWGLYLLDHQFYFTPESLEEVTRRAGFSGFRVTKRNRHEPEALTTDSTARDRRRRAVFDEAVARWPKHGAINVMIAVATA